MKIVGLSGNSGSGKDTVAEYLQNQYDFHHFSVGATFRNEYLQERASISRKLIIESYLGFLKREGQTYFLNRFIEQASRSGYRQITINGIRQLSDYNYLCSLTQTHVLLIYLNLNESLRFERVLSRGRTGEGSNYSEFKTISEFELNSFDYEQLKKRADFVIENGRSIVELQLNLDRILYQVEFI